MDILEAKNRIAAALVEAIFRRARYEIQPYHGGAGLRVGREDFSPDFRVRLPGSENPREHLVEVRYHPAVEQFLLVESQRGERSLFQMARRHWPDLYFVLVTDRPEPGRSCFQVVQISAWPPGHLGKSRDLAEVEEFGIFPHNVTDHEELLRRILALLTGV